MARHHTCQPRNSTPPHTPSKKRHATTKARQDTAPHTHRAGTPPQTSAEKQTTPTTNHRKSQQTNPIRPHSYNPIPPRSVAARRFHPVNTRQARLGPPATADHHHRVCPPGPRRNLRPGTRRLATDNGAHPHTAGGAHFFASTLLPCGRSSNLFGVPP